MILIENKYISDAGIEIIYKYKPRKYDNKHLIIVFSGFGGVSEFTYDFQHSLDNCPAHILWIKDCFYSHCSYYLCYKMSFDIENAIYSFICHFIKDLNLEKNNVTLIGFSKGGSAAIYYGLKYNFSNILCTVPQFYIGSYVKKNWPKIYDHMLGHDANEIALNLIDSLIPDILKNDFELNKNIYLITSKADCQYHTELVPNLDYFFKYKNFNLLLSKSLLVREHNQVTVYHVPLITGILNSLAQGAPPHYGFLELFGDNALPNTPPSAEPVAVLKKISFSNNKMFPEGVSFLRGVSCEKYEDIYVKLCFFDGSKQIAALNMAKKHVASLSREYYIDHFVNYDKAWFCTYKHMGLDLSELPIGTYQLYLQITTSEFTKKVALSSELVFDEQGICDGYSIEIRAKFGFVELIKRKL